MTTVSVITGAGGMGAPRRGLLGSGNHIVLFDISQDRLDAAVAELDGTGPDGTGLDGTAVTAISAMSPTGSPSTDCSPPQRVSARSRRWYTTAGVSPGWAMPSSSAGSTHSAP